MRTLLFCLIILFVSCKKENDNTENLPQSREEKISALIDKITGAHKNAVKYCSTRDIPTGSYSYDTAMNYSLTIYRYNDTMLGTAADPWRFSGDIEKNIYGFVPVNGMPPPHAPYISIDSALSALRYSFGISGLGDPTSCYVIVELN